MSLLRNRVHSTLRAIGDNAVPARPRESQTTLRLRLRNAGWLPALAVLAAGAFALNAFIAADAIARLANGALRDDWTSFYAAATMVRQGDAARLYDLPAMAAAQDSLYGFDDHTNLFPLPAFAAIALSPLARLSFHASFGVWLGINIALLAGMVLMAIRASVAWPRAHAAAFAALAATSAPVVAVLLLSQVDLVVLAAAVGCFALRRSGRGGLAGAVLACGLIKPHLIAPIVLLLIVKRDWRTLASFAATGALLIALPMLIAGPGALADQFALWFSFPGYGNELNAARMINLRGAVLSIWPDAPLLVWLAPSIAIAAACTVAAVRLWMRKALLDQHSWAIALLLPVVCSPHVHWNSAVFALAGAWFFVDAVYASGDRVRIAWFLAGYVALTILWLLGLILVALAVAALLPLLIVMLRWRPETAADTQARAVPQRIVVVGAS